MKTINTPFWIGLFFLFSCSNEEWIPQEESETPIVQEEGPAPTTPILISPTDQQTCEEGEDVSSNFRKIDFAWQATENTTAYDLKVVNLNTEKEHYKTNITSTSDYLILDKNYPYSWQIISRSMTSTVSASSALWRFYVPGDGIVNHAPFPAIAVKPTSGALVIPDNGKVTLQWEGTDPDEDALTFTLYFDTVDGFQNPQQQHIDLQVSTIEVNVLPETVYYWRIKSSDGANSSFTVPFVFQTQ